MFHYLMVLAAYPMIICTTTGTEKLAMFLALPFSSRSSFPSCHEVRPINDLFQPEHCDHPVISLMVSQIIVFQVVESQEVVLGV
jgi:hypothetical protein